ncbi:hypothetical protein DFJ74DRAFT_770403 [Hyaloraphidium curvatum]|nr:hypothetical protein DFJ74DRAFT_770403 [Hyaloraphidium curvatum]
MRKPTRFVAFSRAFDFRKLGLISALAADVLAGSRDGATDAPEVEEIFSRLKDIEALPPHVPDWVKDWIVLPLISALMAALFYNGPWISCALALPLGYVQSVVKLAVSGANPILSHIRGLLTATIVGLLAGCIVGSGTFIDQGVCFGTVGLAGVVWTIPGLALVLAGIQLITGDIGAGATNLAAAILGVFLLGFGLEFGLQITLLFGLPGHPQPNCNSIPVSGWWYFLLFPLVGTLYCLAYGVWYGLQLLPSIEAVGIMGFGCVLLVSTFCACLAAFIYMRWTMRSAFPTVFLALQFIVPGGLALKQALSDFGSTAGFTGSIFATKVLAGALGATVGAILAQAAVWPRIGTHGWKNEPYR